MIGVLLILLIGLVGPDADCQTRWPTRSILQAPSALHGWGPITLVLDIFAKQNLVWGCSHLAVRFRYGYSHCQRDWYRWACCAL